MFDRCQFNLRTVAALLCILALNVSGIAVGHVVNVGIDRIGSLA